MKIYIKLFLQLAIPWLMLSISLQYMGFVIASVDDETFFHIQQLLQLILYSLYFGAVLPYVLLNFLHIIIPKTKEIILIVISIHLATFIIQFLLLTIVAPNNFSEILPTVIQNSIVTSLMNIILFFILIFTIKKIYKSVVSH